MSEVAVERVWLQQVLTEKGGEGCAEVVYVVGSRVMDGRTEGHDALPARRGEKREGDKGRKSVCVVGVISDQAQGRATNDGGGSIGAQGGIERTRRI